ncbi:MAG TPA: VTT domain-containing protein [Dokdonella sp.]|uniref:TVP38/TMEM64 family protein n=1 Tax=Dokdonella sp. TaxID=2291710 RepID=UPI002D7E9D9A|nr:VTT domain-containing protein [Dokdonella sp.]HET9031376.1 VTT domain-containing protein [Dokdonella sp.]
MNQPAEPLPHAERRRRLLKRELRSIVPLALAVVLIVIAAIMLGQEVERHLQAIESWIAELGPWGRLAFVGLVVIGTSLLIPESLFGLIAGALFGLAWGIGLLLVGNLLAAALQYALARRLLHARIQRALQSRPLLHSIQKAVIGNELRLQFLLRLTPLNPALVSYLLGAAGVRFGGFMLASLALISHFAIEVYLGHAGKQLISNGFSGDQAGWMHELLIFGGAAIGLIAVVFVSRVAHRAVLRAIAESAADADKAP